MKQKKQNKVSISTMRIAAMLVCLLMLLCQTIGQGIVAPVIAQADEELEGETMVRTSFAPGMVLHMGDRFRLEQEYTSRTPTGRVTLPVDTDIEVVSCVTEKSRLGFQIGDSVYGIMTDNSYNGIDLDTVSIGYISGNLLICFQNKTYTSNVSTVYAGDILLKGSYASMQVNCGEEVKYISQMDGEGTIKFHDNSTMSLPEGYNAWYIANCKNSVYTLEPYYFGHLFQVTVPEGTLVEGTVDGQVNIGESIVLKSRKLYCVIDGDNIRTVAEMTRDEYGYYCCTIDRVLNDITVEYRNVVRTLDELLTAQKGDFFIPSEDFSIETADGEGNVAKVGVDGCIRTWEENGEQKTIFAETSWKNNGTWTQASANGYMGHIQFHADGTIDGTYNGVAETNVPALDKDTPTNGWVVKWPLQKSSTYLAGNGEYVNRYSFHLYGAAYEEAFPQFFAGKVLHSGDTMRLDGPLVYYDVNMWPPVELPAGTEVTFVAPIETENGMYPCGFTYDGQQSIMSPYNSIPPYYENPVYTFLDSLVITGGRAINDTGYYINELRWNVVFGKDMEFDCYCIGDVFTSAPGGSMFESEKQFVVGGNQVIAVWGIDENGNFIDADHQIVYPSDQNNAWRITGNTKVNDRTYFTLEPYQFSADLNVTVGEGIESIGVENGTVPAFSSVTFKSKEMMRIKHNGRIVDIRRMTKDADGYYIAEVPAVVTDVIAEPISVITSKDGLRTAQQGDIFMPVADEDITEEDTWFSSFCVSLAQHEYIYNGEMDGHYNGEDSAWNFRLGMDNVLHIHADSSFDFLQDWDESEPSNDHISPSAVQGQRSNCWLITNMYDAGLGPEPRYYFEMSGFDAPYQYQEAVAPTCTEDGSIAHWNDLAGRYFADDAGAEPLASITDPATGHDYQAEYIWTKSKNTYTCTAKVTCSHEDMDAEYVDLDVVKEGNTYTAAGQFGQMTLGDIYVVEIPFYQIAVENGIFKQWEETTVNVEQETKVTVCANEPAAGYYFTGWYANDGQEETLVSRNETYTFFAEKDVTLVAKYEEEEPVFDENDVTSNVTYKRMVKTANKDTLLTISSYGVSNEQYAIKRTGYIYAAGEWTNETLTLETEGVKNKYMDCNAYNAYFTFNLNLEKAAIATIRPYYIVYNWDTGEDEQIVYGDAYITMPNR